MGIRGTRERRRDFHRQRISNPFFGRERRSRMGAWLRYLVTFSLFAGGVYASLYAPLFRVDRVSVEGELTVPAEQLAAAAEQTLAGYVGAVFPRDHLLFIDEESLVTAVNATGHPIRRVTVRKGFRSIILRIEERKPTFRLIEPESSYLLDQDGRVLRLATAGEGEELVALRRQGTAEPLVVGTEAVPPSWSVFVGDLHQHFATHTGVRDRIIVLNIAESTVEAVTVEDWYAIFDPSLELGAQLASLTDTIVGRFGPAERAKLNYIDVRFGDRVFYKWKD